MIKVFIKKRYGKVLFLLALLAAVIFSATSTSARTEEFNGEVISGESIELDEFTFIVTMNKYANRIFVNGGNMFKSVVLFECESMEHFEICFDNTTFDLDDNELYAKIRIFRSKPEVTITRTLNDTDLRIGDEAIVTITLTNNGDPASQIIMTDDYPPSIEIFDFDGGNCMEHENQVYWQGHLDEGESKVCRFHIRGKEELHKDMVAILKYWNGFRWITDYSASDHIDITKPDLEIFSTLLREDFEVDGQTLNIDDEDDVEIFVGEAGRLVVNISNPDSTDMRVKSFEVRLPEGVQYVSAGSVRFNYINSSGNRSGKLWAGTKLKLVDGQRLTWDGWLKDNKTSRLFIPKIKATRTGTFQIDITVDYETDEGRFLETKQQNFKVSDPGIRMMMTVSDDRKRFSAPIRLSMDDDDEDNLDIEAFHPYRFTVYTQNRNPFSKLSDIDVKVLTDLAGFKDIHYPLIEEEGRVIPYGLVITPPGVKASTDFPFNITVKYTNDYGETNENSTEFTFKVIPFEDLTIDKSLSESSTLISKENTDVTVKITNDRLVDIPDVHVRDILSPGLEVTGVHSNRVKLLRESETDVYTYRISAPIVFTPTDFNITTIVSFFDEDIEKDFQFNETTTITVNPLEPDVSLDVETKTPDEIYLGYLIPVTYTLKNNEDDEIVRDLTVRFPIQEEFDMVGPETYFVKKLDPGETVELKEIVKARPKVIGEDMNLGEASVEFYDDYGNGFVENSSDESFDIEQSNINGPSLFLETSTPDVTNITHEGTVRITVRNEGTKDAVVNVTQDGHSWEITVPKQSKTSVEYSRTEETEGNYTIEDPVLRYDLHGFPAYTKGTGAQFLVKMIYGPSTNVTEEIAQPEAEVIPPEPEKEEMSFEEFNSISGLKDRQKLIKYGISSVIVLIVLFIGGFYFRYRQNKTPASTFIEGEKKE